MEGHALWIISILSKAFIVSGLSYTWCRVLTAPGMICAWVPRAWARVKSEWVRKNIGKVVYTCPVCNTFWISFSYFLLDSNIEGTLGVVYFIPACLFFQVLILRAEQ